MKMPTKVTSRRMAVVADLGFDPGVVPVDSFSREGFEVIGEDKRGRITACTFGEPVKTFIAWPDDLWETRADEAMRGDFDEMFGAGSSDALDRMLAATRPNNQMVVNHGSID